MKRALLALARTFPRAFHEQFGAEVRDQIERDYDVARAKGLAALAGFSIATAFDLALTSITERIRPTWASHTQQREGSRMSMMSEWARDLRHAARSLRRTPGFAVVTIGTLGLAIGVNAGMFSVVDTVLLKPLPFAHVDRLVNISGTAPGSGFPDDFGVAAEFFVQYKEQSKLIEDISTYNSFTSTLRVGDRVEDRKSVV